MKGNLKLRSAIVARGYKQYEIADMLNMKRSGFNRKIQGKSEFKESEIRQICNILNVSPMEIFFSDILTIQQQHQQAVNK